MSIEQERRLISKQLAEAAGIGTRPAEHAVQVQYEKPPPGRRNMVSILASAATLAALLETLSDDDRGAWLGTPSGRGKTFLEELLDGEIVRVYSSLADHVAGPYDVSWDGNWPHGKAKRSLRGKLPQGAQVGDTLTGGDGGGTRIRIRVVEEPDGTLTGDVLADTWTDPPMEDVWLSTYRRLEDLYPEALPRT